MKLTRLMILVPVMLALVLGGSGLAGAQDGEGIVRGGTVVISEGQQAPFVRNFNPYAPDPTRWTAGAIYETLVIYNPVAGGVPTPWLASNFAWSDDLLSLTYTLRRDVLWNDGEPFTADDVVFTFELIADHPAIDRGGILHWYAGVEKIDDYTVRVDLSDVYTLAPEVIATHVHIVPQHAWANVDDPVTFTNPDPVGTGPLATVATLTEQMLELCRNENYWQMGADGAPLPYIDCIRMPVFPGNDPANQAAMNGELDWIGNFIANIDATFVAADPAHHHYYFWPGGKIVQLYMNTTLAPFSDVEFRRALSAAIDYEAITTLAIYGYTEPSNAVGIGPRYADWISPDALDLAAEMGLAAYNPDLAEAILDAAGYVDANDDGWRDMPNGDAIDVEIQVVTGWTDWVTSVQIMTENFQDIGLNTTMVLLDYDTFLANLQSGSYSVSIGWDVDGGNTPWDHFRAMMDSSLIGEDGTANGQLWGRWTSAEADDLLAQFTATADLELRTAIMDELQRVYVENVVTIPLFPNPNWYEWTTHRFTGFPTEEDYYTHGSPWNREGRMIVLTRIHCLSEETCAEAQ